MSRRNRVIIDDFRVTFVLICGMGFAWCMTYWLVWLSPRALWKKMLIKDGMCGGVERVVQSHEQVVMSTSSTYTEIYHEL